MRSKGCSQSITISDVAREAGVGLGTVSRVMNDHPSVSPATREKVRQAIRKLGYCPNAQARRLARGSTETIAFILSNRSCMHAFHARILEGVEAYCASTRHQVVYTTCRYPADVKPSQLKLPTIISTKGVADGAIIAGTNYPNFIAALDGTSLPYVLFANNLIGGRPPKYDAVSSDDDGGGYQATRHLLELGHTHIAFIADTQFPWFRRRYEGYARAMEEAGLAPQKWAPAPDAGEAPFGTGAVREMLRQGARATAIFAGNDFVAYAAWRGLREAGLYVPDDMSLIGFDDREEALLIEPPLTTIRVLKEEIGVECTRLLFEKIKSPRTKLPAVMLPTELVIRMSTAPFQEGSGMNAG